MKKIILIITLIISLTCESQVIVNTNIFNQGNNSGKYFKDLDNNFQNFIGTWENTSGNKTFRVTLFKITKKPFGYPIDYYADEIGGSFQIIENINTTNELVLNNSIKFYPLKNITSTSVIHSSPSNPIIAKGYIEDNCATGQIGWLTGYLSMTIMNSGSNPLIMHWIVEQKAIYTEGESYSVPKDILLTKMN